MYQLLIKHQRVDSPYGNMRTTLVCGTSYVWTSKHPFADDTHLTREFNSRVLGATFGSIVPVKSIDFR